MSISDGYYDTSYPPSLWGGGGPGPGSGPATGVVPGQPGSFTPAGCDVPANLAELQALGALGQTSVWYNQWVVLGDGSWARWGGAWEVVLPSTVGWDSVTAGSPAVVVPDVRPAVSLDLNLDPRWGDSGWGWPSGETWPDWEFVEIGPATGPPTDYMRLSSRSWVVFIQYADLVALQYTEWDLVSTPWTADQYMPLLDGTFATWGGTGTGWIARAVPTWPTATTSKSANRKKDS